METKGSNHSHDNQPSEDSKTICEGKKSLDDVRDSVFVNHAEIAWHQSRREWVGDRSQKPKRMPREPIMSWTTTYEDLLLSIEPFDEPIPLAEMVDFLVDTWLEEGLYD
ncbi:hypothetical protein L1049_007865 [Liquidambar formosana]|uniref:Gag1-like clamp domain-containing protein n=1 Tax=Liquidambar formosana TaxID=63359 RepID=A0AAP0X472_LIQFO